ncbi:hypothetical protein GMA19_02296 [Paenibacillus polymyxa E681]|nr:hypothetical protein GE561_02296 [Paenibacillus polymyxa E681]QNV61966.1 hypothetical protein GMA19_02296 [Paenibacillus polymyxa E681]
MTTIKVTPEQLITVSKKFELAQQTAMQMNSQLSQQISFMERFWEGITKEQFYFKHLRRIWLILLHLQIPLLKN